jgi:hypothetical protein
LIGGIGLSNITLTFATVQALKDGYDVLYVTDAVGGRSQTAHPTGIERLAHADAVPRLGGAARRAGPRRHLLVLQRGSEAHR